MYTLTCVGKDTSSIIAVIMNLDNDHYNREIIVVNNNDDPSAFALNEVSWKQRKQLTSNLRNHYGNVSVGSNWGENLVWILLLGGFAGLLVLIT